MNDTVVQPTYAFEGFRLDAQHRVLSRANGEPIPLAPKVFDALLYFVERPGQLIGKRELLEAIWPHVVVEENNLNQAISGLRRVLGETVGAHRFIVTAPGHGYRFVAEVRIASATDEVTREPAAVVTAAAEVAAVGGPRSAKPRSGQRLVAALVAALALTAGGVWLIQREGALPAAGTQPSASQERSESSLWPNSVAVLPLESVGPGPDQAAFAVGLHFDIINQLGRLRTLTVIGREAVVRAAATSNSLAEIATALRVQSLLSGTFQYLGGRIHVNLELVDPLTGRILWAEDYDAAFQDILAVQADIATKVTAALNAELTVADRRRMDLRRQTPIAAYSEYLLALNSQTSGNRDEALAQLERAVRIDPAFAEAHGRLALAYAQFVIDFSNAAAVSLDPEEMERRATQHADRALELDQNLAVAHTALGELHAYFWRWTDAESEFNESYRLDPNDLDMQGFYCHFRAFRGDYDGSLRLADRLRVIDPHFDSLCNWIAHVYAGSVDEAAVTLNEQLVLYPASVPPLINLGFIEARRGDVQAAQDAFDLVEQLTSGRRSANLAAGLAYGYARIDRAETAMELFQEVENAAAAGTVGDGTRALAYLAIGAEEQALAWLDRAVLKIEAHQPDAGWFNLMTLKHNVTGDRALEDPRFKDLRQRIRGS